MPITVETDLMQILEKMDRKLDALREDVTEIKIKITKIEGDIKAMDTRLTGEIKAIDVKLSGEINTLDSKVDGISKRIDNQEFTSRAILASLVVVIIGTFLKMFGILPSNIA
jgi:peptidoglycan hydrolase CwlO-like protein